jgi:hypothetical protein
MSSETLQQAGQLDALKRSYQRMLTSGKAAARWPGYAVVERIAMAAVMIAAPLIM